jgi:phosphotransferase system HPr (HPr) family protein
VDLGWTDSAPGDPAGSTVPHAGLSCPQTVMNVQPLQQIVTIRDPQGLHMRPAAAFAKAARGFQSTVTLRHNDRSVNGKSQLDLMLLAAEPGVQLVLEVAGEDAAAALPALADVIEAVSAEGEDDDSGPPPKG